MNIIRLPSIIDIHVHFRDPGQTYKEDFFTGTSAALAGGVTTVFDMPNNKVPIFTEDALREKMSVAQKKAVCDYGFYFGTDGKNTDEFEKVKDFVVGLKVYLNLTTGKLLIEDEGLVEKIFATWPKEKIIVIHAEGKKVDLAIELANTYKSRLHITHVATERELSTILAAKDEEVSITCDVTPHHLFLSQDHLGYKEAYYEVKPPLAAKEDQEFLWEHIQNIDCIATDHAPHTKEEKESSTPPSGLPGLETMLPLLLTAVHEGRMSTDDIIRLLHTGPKKVLGLKDASRHAGGKSPRGWQAEAAAQAMTPPRWNREDSDTYTEVDFDEEWIVRGKNLKTKCGWSPFEGWKMKGKVKKVYIRGKKVYENDKILIHTSFAHKDKNNAAWIVKR